MIRRSADAQRIRAPLEVRRLLGIVRDEAYRRVVVLLHARERVRCDVENLRGCTRLALQLRRRGIGADDLAGGS